MYSHFINNYEGNRWGSSMATMIVTGKKTSIKEKGSSCNEVSCIPKSSLSASPSPPPPPSGAPPTPPNMMTPDLTTTPVHKLVVYYSTVYQYYANQGNQHRHVSLSLPSSSKEKVELESCIAWADYYADQSSRCAHYYNDVMTKRSKTDEKLLLKHKHKRNVNLFEVITSKINRVETIPCERKVGNRVVNSSENSNKFSNKSTECDSNPESFNRFAYRCLEGCLNNTQRSYMKKNLENMAKDAILKCYMQTKNWDLEPLLPLAIDSIQHTNDEERSHEGIHKSLSSSNLGTFSSSSEILSGSSGVTVIQSNVPSFPDKCGNIFYCTNDNFPYKKIKSKNVNDGNLLRNDSYYGPANFSEVGSYGKEVDYNSLIQMKKYNKINSSKTKHNKRKKEPCNDGFERSEITLARRADRFSSHASVKYFGSSDLHSEYVNCEGRFMGKSIIGGSKQDGKSKKFSVKDYEKMTVKGTCQKLKKDYLRLTAPPRAELVRPQPILERHLMNLKEQWFNQRSKIPGQEIYQKKKDYTWFCSQLKAIRQDLIVQRISNPFCVDVYETHARIALEEDDLNEYNQSQTQLKELYDSLEYVHGINGNEKHINSDYNLRTGLENQVEFLAYRIIYCVMLAGNEKYNRGSSDIFKIFLGLTSEQISNSTLSHALAVRMAVAENDYHNFFRLQRNCPNLGAHLMDRMVPQMRAVGLKYMIKAYHPSISTDFILEELGFCSGGDSGLSWLMGCGCKFSHDNSEILNKETVLNESYLTKNISLSLI